MVNRYRALREHQQQEVKEFPILFAFTAEQLLEGLKKWDVDEKEIISVTKDGYILSKDREAYISMMLRHKDELLKALDNQDYLYDMFRHEMENHEYFISGDLDDALQGCPVSIEEIADNPLMQETLEKVKEAYIAAC